MRDPSDPRPRAYELLGVPLEATQQQVDKAYQQLTRTVTDHAQRERLTAAWRRLRTPRGRVEEALWHLDPSLGTGAGAPQPPDAAGTQETNTVLDLELAASLLPGVAEVDLRWACLDLLDPTSEDARPALFTAEPCYAELVRYRPVPEPLRLEMDR